MIAFTVYNVSGKILRTGVCSETDFKSQAGNDEIVIRGTANDVTQKVVDGKIVDKTPGEIAIDNLPRPVVQHEKQAAHITNKQWQAVLDRIAELESNR